MTLFEDDMSRPTWLLEESSMRIELADTPRRMADVICLRDEIYVSEEGRLSSVKDTASTFDRFDDHSTYFVAYADGIAVGAVKVVENSELGLPCEMNGELVSYPEDSRRVEVGHLLSSTRARSARLGTLLMKQSLVYGIGIVGATHVLGDFFADGRKDGGLKPFYINMGFRPASRPYSDTRFVGAPASIVGILDVEEIVRLLPTARGGQRRILDFFFGDYPWLHLIKEREEAQ